MKRYLNIISTYCIPKSVTFFNFFMERFHSSFICMFIRYTYLNIFENFLLVMLCRYDLGEFSFAIFKWISCLVYCLSSIVLCFPTSEDILMVTAFQSTAEPVFAKDLHILVPEAKNLVCSVDEVYHCFNYDSIERVEDKPERIIGSPNNYTTGLALFLLYCGLCISKSGG